MNKLKFKDIVNVHKYDSNNCEIPFLKTRTTSPSMHMGTIEIVQSSQKIELKNKITNDLDDDELVKKAINMLLDNVSNDNLYKFPLYPSGYKHYVDLTDNNEKKAIEIKKRLISKVYQLIHNVSIETKFGPANKIIVPESLKNVDFETPMNLYWTSKLKTHIIVLRKSSDSHEPALSYCYNNDYYSLDFIGDYDKYYNVLQTKPLSVERTEKITRLC